MHSLSGCGARGEAAFHYSAQASRWRSTGSRHTSFSSCSTWASAVHGSVKPGTTVGLQPSRLPPPRPHSPKSAASGACRHGSLPPLSTLDPTCRSVISLLPEKEGNLLLGDVITPGCKWGGNFPSVHYSLWAPDKGVTEALRGPSFLPSSVPRPYSPLTALRPCKLADISLHAHRSGVICAQKSP